MSVQGENVNPDEVDAVFARLKTLADQAVPGWERGMVSDDLLRRVAAEAVAAVNDFRKSPSI